MVSFSHTDPGTAEARWLAAGVTQLPALPPGWLPGAARPLVVLSAHPDDETLGAGGLIRTALGAGSRVHLIACTAGEASHPHSPTHSPRRLARIREAELERALDALRPDAPGAGTLTFEILGVPDGRLAEHEGTVESAIRGAAGSGDTVLVAPYRHDGHCDHDALGALAARLADELHCGLLEYPIWYWHWATPQTNTQWTRWHALALDAESAAAKKLAMDCHASQTSPLSGDPRDAALLHGTFLEHFARPSETFRYTAAGLRDSATATTTFDGLYAQRPDPWHYLGSPYEERKRAVTLASLPRSRYATVLELGCSIGVLTAELAPRAGRLLAVDASQVALDAAARHLEGLEHIELAQAVLPHQWPAVDPGSQELVMVSEIGYFLAPDELDLLLARCLEALAPNGHLLLCHWLHPVSGWPLDGAQVHEAARNLPVQPLVYHREQDFLLEVFGKANGHAG